LFVVCSSSLVNPLLSLIKRYTILVLLHLCGNEEEEEDLRKR